MLEEAVNDMNDVISTLKSRRGELALELGRIDKAIAILSNGSGASARGKATRAQKSKTMSAAMKAKIGRGVRRAFLQRKREAAKAKP
jgi:hypothetical protein